VPTPSGLFGNSEAAFQVARDPPRAVDTCHALLLVRYDTSLMNGNRHMTAADFRRIALSLEGVEEYSHAGLPAFRVGGRKFASLASQAEGYGNLMLTLEQQAAFVEEAPEIFLPITGGWGKMGHTHIRLAASEDVLTGALRTAWKLRIDKNAKTSRKKSDVAGARRSKPSSRAWWIPYLFRAEPERAARYQIMFGSTHRFLPTRNGLVPNTAHIMLHLATAATLVTLIVL